MSLLNFPQSRPIGVFLVSFLVVTGLQAQVGIDFNPQVGVHSLRLNKAPTAAAETNYKTGFLVGMDLRIGNRVFFQPGVFYTNAKTVFRNDDILSTNPDEVARHALKVRTVVGVNVLQTDALALRLGAGPSYDFVVGWGDRDNVVYRDPNFKNGNAALEIAFGMDISFVSAEIGYAHGLSKVFTEDQGFQPKTRYRGIYASLGILLGDREDYR
jgi:hypothetical protein